MVRYQRSRKNNRKNPLIIATAFVALCLGIFTISVLWPNKTEAPHTSHTSKSKVAAKKPAPEPTKKLPKIDLQPTVDAWVASQPGSYGIFVYDPANKTAIASHQPDKQFFTASIYKLYVAYLALIDIQSGVQNPDAVILSGQTLKQCIYKMIHSSDSPCGEKVLNSMGQAVVTKRLKETFGLTNTNFPGFVTSAQDAALILQRLQAKQDLNAENTAFLLDAMKTQVYRTGLPKGMPEATVADKIGFNDPQEWHDTAIVTLPNGREYIISILGGEGVRSTNIASFGQTIFTQLDQ